MMPRPNGTGRGTGNGTMSTGARGGRRSATQRRTVTAGAGAGAVSPPIGFGVTSSPKDTSIHSTSSSTVAPPPPPFMLVPDDACGSYPVETQQQLPHQPSSNEYRQPVQQAEDEDDWHWDPSPPKPSPTLDDHLHHDLQWPDQQSSETNVTVLSVSHSKDIGLPRSPRSFDAVADALVLPDASAVFGAAFGASDPTTSSRRQSSPKVSPTTQPTTCSTNVQSDCTSRLEAEDKRADEDQEARDNDNVPRQLPSGIPAPSIRLRDNNSKSKRPPVLPVASSKESMPSRAMPLSASRGEALNVRPPKTPTEDVLQRVSYSQRVRLELSPFAENAAFGGPIDLPPPTESAQIPNGPHSAPPGTMTPANAALRRAKANALLESKLRPSKTSVISLMGYIRELKRSEALLRLELDKAKRSTAEELALSQSRVSDLERSLHLLESERDAEKTKATEQQRIIEELSTQLTELRAMSERGLSSCESSPFRSGRTMNRLQLEDLSLSPGLKELPSDFKSKQKQASPEFGGFGEGSTPSVETTARDESPNQVVPQSTTSSSPQCGQAASPRSAAIAPGFSQRMEPKGPTKSDSSPRDVTPLSQAPPRSPDPRSPPTVGSYPSVDPFSPVNAIPSLDDANDLMVPPQTDKDAVSTNLGMGAIPNSPPVSRSEPSNESPGNKLMESSAQTIERTGDDTSLPYTDANADTFAPGIAPIHNHTCAPPIPASEDKRSPLCDPAPTLPVPPPSSTTMDESSPQQFCPPPAKEVIPPKAKRFVAAKTLKPNRRQSEPSYSSKSPQSLEKLLEEFFLEVDKKKLRMAKVYGERYKTHEKKLFVELARRYDSHRVSELEERYFNRVSEEEVEEDHVDSEVTPTLSADQAPTGFAAMVGQSHAASSDPRYQQDDTGSGTHEPNIKSPAIIPTPSSSEYIMSPIAATSNRSSIFFGGSPDPAPFLMSAASFETDPTLSSRASTTNESKPTTVDAASVKQPANGTQTSLEPSTSQHPAPAFPDPVAQSPVPFFNISASAVPPQPMANAMRSNNQAVALKTRSPTRGTRNSPLKSSTEWASSKSQRPPLGRKRIDRNSSSNSPPKTPLPTPREELKQTILPPPVQPPPPIQQQFQQPQQRSPQPSPPAPAPVTLEGLLSDLYRKHQPDKLANVPLVARQFFGKERELVRLLKGKYGALSVKRLEENLDQLEQTWRDKLVSNTKRGNRSCGSFVAGSMLSFVVWSVFIAILSVLSVVFVSNSSCESFYDESNALWLETIQECADLQSSLSSFKYSDMPKYWSARFPTKCYCSAWNDQTNQLMKSLSLEDAEKTFQVGCFSRGVTESFVKDLTVPVLFDGQEQLMVSVRDAVSHGYLQVMALYEEHLAETMEKVWHSGSSSLSALAGKVVGRDTQRTLGQANVYMESFASKMLTEAARAWKSIVSQTDRVINKYKSDSSPSLVNNNEATQQEEVEEEQTDQQEAEIVRHDETVRSVDEPEQLVVEVEVTQQGFDLAVKEEAKEASSEKIDVVEPDQGILATTSSVGDAGSISPEDQSSMQEQTDQVDQEPVEAPATPIVEHERDGPVGDLESSNPEDRLSNHEDGVGVQSGRAEEPIALVEQPEVLGEGTQQEDVSHESLHAAAVVDGGSHEAIEPTETESVAEEVLPSDEPPIAQVPDLPNDVTSEAPQVIADDVEQSHDMAESASSDESGAEKTDSLFEVMKQQLLDSMLSGGTSSPTLPEDSSSQDSTSQDEMIDASSEVPQGPQALEQPDDQQRETPSLTSPEVPVLPSQSHSENDHQAVSETVPSDQMVEETEERMAMDAVNAAIPEVAEQSVIETASDSDESAAPQGEASALDGSHAMDEDAMQIVDDEQLRDRSAEADVPPTEERTGADVFEDDGVTAPGQMAESQQVVPQVEEKTLEIEQPVAKEATAVDELSTKDSDLVVDEIHEPVDQLDADDLSEMIQSEAVLLEMDLGEGIVDEKGIKSSNNGEHEKIEQVEKGTLETSDGVQHLDQAPGLEQLDVDDVVLLELAADAAAMDHGIDSLEGVGLYSDVQSNEDDSVGEMESSFKEALEDQATESRSELAATPIVDPEELLADSTVWTSTTSPNELSEEHLMLLEATLAAAEQLQPDPASA